MDTSAIAIRHGETNDYFTGTKTRARQSDSYVTRQVIEAYKEISQVAKSSGLSKNDVSLGYLRRHLDSLKSYITSKGEVVQDSDNGVIIQAALLRMEDIKIVALAGNLSDDDALAEIEKAESEAIINDLPDKDNVLPPDTQAALNCIVLEIFKQMNSAVGTATISDALTMIKKSMATPLQDNKGMNAAIGDDLDLSSLQASTLQLPNATNTDTDGSSDTSFWDTLSKIAATATTVAKSIQSIGSSTATTINQVGNAVQTVGANTGASAISLYLQRNGFLILIVLAIFILLIVLISRGTKGK